MLNVKDINKVKYVKIATASLFAHSWENVQLDIYQLKETILSILLQLL